MSRKNYEALAVAFAKGFMKCKAEGRELTAEQKATITSEITKVLQKDNPNFSLVKFADAIAKEEGYS